MYNFGSQLSTYMLNTYIGIISSFYFVCVYIFIHTCEFVDMCICEGLGTALGVVP